MTANDLSDNLTTAQPVVVTVQNEYYGVIENFSLSVSEENISLSWDAPYNAETFKVYRDSVFLVEISDQSYDDTIESGVEYCYQISAVNSVGIEGPVSEEECGVPQLPAPDSFSATINDTNLTLVWAAVNNASGYILYRDNTEIWNGTALTLTDLGLTYNTTYIYNVVAFDLDGTHGTESDPLSVTMPEELIAPTLSIYVLGTDGSLSWTSLSSATAYRVHQDSVFIVEVTTTNYETELIHGVETCFTVTAINDVGSESDSSNVVCGTGDFTPPVLSLSITESTITESTASLSWNSVVSAETYRVYQDTNFLIEVSEITLDLEIPIDTETCFEIEAVNSYGTTSDTSNVECGTGS
jgi:fibronectin type 3 domain-containing protein